MGGKIRVAVLYGGRSAEHEVSVRSAANVIQHLDSTRFEVIPIGIDKAGNWFLGHETFNQSLVQQHVLTHDSAWFTAEWISKTSTKQSLVASSSNKPVFDVVFPVVHGTMCEDGTLQGLLELADLPYVGCGVLSSAMGMDKDISKRLAVLAGVPVAPYLVLKHTKWQENPAAYLHEIKEKLSYPLFVKPANTGSSIGITKVKQEADLKGAIEEAFKFDTKILVENGLDVLELEVAVLEALHSSDPFVSTVGEIKSHHEFYSYEAKYIDENGAELLIPASVSELVRKEAQQVAKTLFVALECEGMARIDLFYNKDNQQVYFNEINTIPGFTQISMYPKLMEASGLSYSELLTHLIELALLRHKKKSKLVRNCEKLCTA